MNKRIVLTGASSGIGRELLNQLLNEGCTVVVASRNIEKVDIRDDRLFLQVCDVSKPEDIDTLFNFAIEKMGEIDIFIANAGFAYYEKLSTPNWQHMEKIIATNNFGLFYAAQKMKEICEAAPYQFVCVASGMSFLSMPGYALYSASKAAIRGFADAYRFELNKGQYFQVVYPIATKTKFFANAGNSPMPWPSQTTDVVAREIIKGIKSKRANIYPSKLFWLMLTLNRLFPFIFTIYSRFENRKFQLWLVENTIKEAAND